MEVLYFNFKWMAFNIFLACIPVVLAQVVFTKRFTILKLVGSLTWFIFLPNTIYLVTDIVNLVSDARVISGTYLVADAALFLSLIPIGIITLVLSISPFEKLFIKRRNGILLGVLNLFIGFGLVLGRVQRVNSWEILINQQNVVSNSLVILKSAELLVVVVLFALLSQVIYLKFRNTVLSVFK